MEGVKTPIKPFPKTTLGKRILKEPTSSTAINGAYIPSTNEDDEEDEDNEVNHVASNENNNIMHIKELKETPSVSLTTILRWKEKKRVDVDCFLGFSDHSSEADKIAGTDILHTLGHFYCLWCQCYIRANKKSAQRHQRQNKKHLLKVNQEIDGINNDDYVQGMLKAHHSSSSILSTSYPKLTNVPSSYDPHLHQQHPSSSSQSSILSHAYLAATKNSDSKDLNNHNHMLSPAPEAWMIISNPLKVQDTDRLSEILTSLGVCDAQDLILCEPNEIIDIISTLKPVGQRRMKQLYHMLLMDDANSSNAVSNSSNANNNANSNSNSNQSPQHYPLQSPQLPQRVHTHSNVNHSLSANMASPNTDSSTDTTTTTTTTTSRTIQHQHSNIHTPKSSSNSSSNNNNSSSNTGSSSSNSNNNSSSSGNNNNSSSSSSTFSSSSSQFLAAVNANDSTGVSSTSADNHPISSDLC